MAVVTAFVQTQVENAEQPNIDIYTVDLTRIGFSDAKFYSHFINFDKTKKYMIAVDQSTSSTGVAVAAEDFSQVVVLTVVCDSKDVYEKQKYITVLLEMLQRLMAGMQLIFWALEEVPPPINGNSRSYKILRELKATIESTVASYPAIRDLDDDMKFNPFPQQWKSTVYNKKEKGKGRFNNKVEIAKDITKLYPSLKDYLRELERTVGHDYDGFDAFGMLIHVRLKHFNENWSRINYDKQTQTGLFFVCMKYIDKSLEDVKAFVSHFTVWNAIADKTGTIKNKFDLRYWSKEKSILTNFIMAANSDKIVCMEAENNKLLISYLIETGQKYDGNKHLWVAVSKSSDMLLQEKHLAALREDGIYCKKYYKLNYKER